MLHAARCPLLHAASTTMKISRIGDMDIKGTTTCLTNCSVVTIYSFTETFVPKCGAIFYARVNLEASANASSTF